MPETLIFDRTKADAARVRDLTQKIRDGSATAAEKTEWLTGQMKGAWNTTDLDRIESWTTYLRDLLAQHGYTAKVVVKSTGWSETDIPRQSDIDRIRGNVDALQSGFVSLPDWREIVYDDLIDIDRANALEWDLQRLYVWFQTMVEASYIKQAGTLFAVAGGVFNG